MMKKILLLFVFFPALIFGQGISIGDKPLSGSNVQQGADWNENLLNIPIGFQDGVDNDTQLTQSEVFDYYNAMVGIVPQAIAEAGTSTTVYRWTPQRIKQSIDALASSSAWSHTATMDINMASNDIINIDGLQIKGSSTDFFDLILSRTNDYSFLYDEKAYNSLSLGYLSIDSDTGAGEFLGDFNIEGAFTVNGSPITGGNPDAILSETSPPTGWEKISGLYFNDFDSDPAPASLPVGYKGLQYNAPPAKVESSTTVLDLGSVGQIDDSTVDTATWTLTNVKAGGEYVVKINLSTEPTIIGATKIPDTAAFEAGTPMLMFVYNFAANGGNQIGYAFIKWF